MKINFIIILFLIASCYSPSHPPENNQVAKPSKKDTIPSPIETYIGKELTAYHQAEGFSGKYIITDSLEVKSLNSTIYQLHIPHSYDFPHYDVIRDNSSGQFFKVVNSSYIRYPSPETQLVILESKDAIEPVNYDYQGLEAFLNSCVMLRNNLLELEALDSIIMFSKMNLGRVTTEKEIINILNEGNEPLYRKDRWQERICKALLSKLKGRNVLLYNLHLNNMLYIEVNPGFNLIDYMNRDTALIAERKKEYKNLVKGNLYNLSIFNIIGRKDNWY
ncbi:MAG: hypothetical protein V4613_14175 [Bacteroidota bacterium]